MFAEVHKKKVREENFSYPPPPHPEKVMVRPLYNSTMHKDEVFYFFYNEL